MFANHLPHCSWEPIVLTVDEHYYEEKPDPELLELIPEEQRIEKVSALPVTRPRIIGDVGLRGFFQLLHRASNLIKRERIDFVYIFIPSFYLAVIGKVLFMRFGVKYGIDYIDPWVHYFPGSEKKFSRHWFSTLVAKILEPWAVSAASLITGVSASYYNPVLKRNPHLISTTRTYAMPYGWDRTEQVVLTKLNKRGYLYRDDKKIRLVYAGAYLPKSKDLLVAFFKVIANNPLLFSDVCIHFIGTGKNQVEGIESSIAQLAHQYGISSQLIFEHPLRLSYFDVLAHVRDASGVFILGSTEPHYSPSKLFNAILMKIPVFALLHRECSVNDVIRSSDWGVVCEYDEQLSQESICTEIERKFEAWKLKTINKEWSFIQEKVESLSVEQLISPLGDIMHAINK